jgi:hypothetical protein
LFVLEITGTVVGIRWALNCRRATQSRFAERLNPNLEESGLIQPAAPELIPDTGLMTLADLIKFVSTTMMLLTILISILSLHLHETFSQQSLRGHLTEVVFCCWPRAICFSRCCWRGLPLAEDGTAG